MCESRDECLRVSLCVQGMLVRVHLWRVWGWGVCGGGAGTSFRFGGGGVVLGLARCCGGEISQVLRLCLRLGLVFGQGSRVLGFGRGLHGVVWWVVLEVFPSGVVRVEVVERIQLALGAWATRALCGCVACLCFDTCWVEGVCDFCDSFAVGAEGGREVRVGEWGVGVVLLAVVCVHVGGSF